MGKRVYIYTLSRRDNLDTYRSLNVFKNHRYQLRYTQNIDTVSNTTTDTITYNLKSVYGWDYFYNGKLHDNDQVISLQQRNAIIEIVPYTSRALATIAFDVTEGITPENYYYPIAALTFESIPYSTFTNLYQSMLSPWDNVYISDNNLHINDMVFSLEESGESIITAFDPRNLDEFYQESNKN